MKPIKIRDTGRGVEDIQRRLKTLGYSLGTCGVDGDFRGETQSAVKAFQKDYQLPITGEVDMRTWSTLVDSTFVFGDRSLYLRKPHFHGQDVTTVQSALTSLGFSSADIDGIFGPHTERAVIEFQTNMDISPDGAVGLETYEALGGLRHIWDRREVSPHSAATPMTQCRDEVLLAHRWHFGATDQATSQIVRRLVNLALASAEGTHITHFQIEPCTTPLGEQDITEHLDHEAMCIVVSHATLAGSSFPLITYDAHRPALIDAWIDAIAQAPSSANAHIIVMPAEVLDSTNKLHYQFIAATILDSLCAVFRA